MFDTDWIRFISIILAFTSALNLTTAVNIPTNDDIKVMTDQRVINVLKSAAVSEDILDPWKNSLTNGGVWTDIDMTSGCEARIANWPAIEHLTRTLSLASAYVNNPTDIAVLSKAILALNYWLDHDFKSSDCVNNGGVFHKKCPCGTPGLWNKNWFNQVIHVPKLIGDICLILKAELNVNQIANCMNIQERAFDNLTDKSNAVRKLTAANLLDVCSVGIDLGLLDENPKVLEAAINFSYKGLYITSTPAGDGIHSDGSFMMHDGILYNGNYGKDYINDVVSVFTETKNTDLVPSIAAQKAFETLISGTEWMIIADTKRNSLIWQYSAIGRMVSFKYEDAQASGGVELDIKRIAESTKGWSIEKSINDITDRLSAPHTISVNQGNLIGTRYFYNADYMVHRTPTYVITMKLYSNRTVNSECTNIQNPYGFHLSDGAIYNYLNGDEYVDVFGAWDWNLIPGITVDIGGTPLKCKTVKAMGVKSFVGGVADNNMGIAVMDFQNSRNHNLSFQKTVFFFPSFYAIQVGSAISKNTEAQLATVLDQRRRNGDIYISGALQNTDSSYTTSKTNSVWHDRIGYYFPTPEVINVDSTPKISAWSDIGISVGNETQQLWTSYIKHSQTSSNGLLSQYIVQPDIDQPTFQNNIINGKIPVSLDFKSSKPQVNAAYSAADSTTAIAFWTSGTYTTPWKSTTITANNPCIILFRQISTATNTYLLTVSDPSQTLETLQVTIEIESIVQVVSVALPTASEAGKGAVYTLSF